MVGSLVQPSDRSHGAGRLWVAVPLYRSPELVEPLFAALAELGPELASLRGRVVLINDSPDDEALGATLAARLPALRRRIDVDLLVNAVNLGFVGSANRALRLACADRADVILLNSDALPTPGAFAEMAAVACTDPMISVVSPRSNNATLCNSPYPDRFRALDAAGALRAHGALQRYLPRVTYAPTAVGFCLYVRRLMIEEFGVFDDVYGAGYNEENDFIMRCNRAGYRAVLANHAFVYHLGHVSFEQTDTSSENRERINSRILLDRYPHYDRAVRRYFNSVEFRTQRLLSGLVPDERGRLRVLLDGRNMGAFHNGTFEHARGLITAFAKACGAEFSIHLVCLPAVAAFHGFDRIEGLSLCDPDAVGDDPFAVAFRIAQPFSLAHLTELGDLGALSGFLFLDTIALDCLELDASDYGRIWDWMAQTVALIGFNSRFTEEQFKRRFTLAPGVVDFVSMCSTDIAEYARPAAAPAESGYVLIVGNHYAHKHVAQTVLRLRAHTDKPLVVLGGDDLTPDDRMTVYKAGELQQSLVDALYDGAEVVVFPSHYEGFGLPILHALARGKPVIARDIGPSREIRAACGEAVNLHLYETTEQMAQAAALDVAWREPASHLTPWTWADAAGALRDAIRQAVARCDYADVHARVVRLDGLARREPVAPEPAAPAPRAPVLSTAVPPGRLRPQAGRSDPGAGADPSAAPTRQVRVKIDRAQSDAVLMTRLLGAAEEMERGDVLVLDAAAGALDPARARLLLVSAGLDPEAGEAGGRRVRLAAKLFVRWTDALKAGAGDAAFVESAYRAALGRSSDPPGLAHYLKGLAEGVDRRAVLVAMFASRERLGLVAAQYGYALGADGALSPLDGDADAGPGVDRAPASA